MMKNTEEQTNIETEYFDKEQTNNRLAGNPIDNNGEDTQPTTLKEPSDAQLNGYAGIYAVRDIGFPKSMFNFDTESALISLYR